ncbi:MAG: threonine ammonia-lyase [Pseudomonadales bacterium]|nr:threonine ammonia-lyase [Pseudomonadales bacterium]
MAIKPLLQTEKQYSSNSISAAYQRIKPYIVNTPVTFSATFSDICGCQVFFKLENQQMTGSFKERGALNKLLSLSATERKQGVIAASAGNHAQAVAYHANRLGIATKIVMPQHSPLIKIQSTEHWGAEVVLSGETLEQAFLYSQQIMHQENQIYIHPFDDARVAEGQGTLGLEILQEPCCESLDAILVPVGGGGLISGLATFTKHHKPNLKIIGIEESSVNAMSTSMAAGKVTTIKPQPMLADGIAVRRVGANNLAVVAELVDELVSVSSDEIANAIMLMLEIEKSVIEASAAVTIAALLNHRLPQLAGKNVLCVISGGNIDVNMLSKIITRGLSFDQRIIQFDTTIDDHPGALEKLLAVFRELGANVLEVFHHRFSAAAPVGHIGVSITLETRNGAHIKQLKQLLYKRGYQISTPTIS